MWYGFWSQGGIVVVPLGIFFIWVGSIVWSIFHNPEATNTIIKNCAHTERIPVDVAFTGEHIADICKACGEQLDPLPESIASLGSDYIEYKELLQKYKETRQNLELLQQVSLAPAIKTVAPKSVPIRRNYIGPRVAFNEGVFYYEGDFLVNDDGSICMCVGAGRPGTWLDKQIASVPVIPMLAGV